MPGFYLDPQFSDVLRACLRREGWPEPARLHPADRGGLTRGGITSENWGDYRGLKRRATAAELGAITDDEALQFYFLRYVQQPGLDQVTDQRLRALLVDWCFTSGDDPIRALQGSLRVRGLYAGAIDGRLGPKTRAGLFADRDPRQTYRDVLAARGRVYVRLGVDARARG